MQKRPDETTSQWLSRLAVVARNLTQDQVEACAWMMGGNGCGWTPINLADGLEESSRTAERLEERQV